MLTIVLILLVLFLFGGTGFYGRRAGWGARGYGGGLLVTILLVVLLVWLFNEATMPPLPMPRGVPSIIKN